MHETNVTSGGPVTRHLENEAATLDMGARLARVLQPGLIIYLSGELGSGKTTLVRGLLRGLGWSERVKSPSFALVELYCVSSLDLYHFDFYRLNDPREWVEAGFREHFDEAAVCLIEWPERAGGQLPPADLGITLQFAGNGRDIAIEAHNERGRQCLSKLNL